MPQFSQLLRYRSWYRWSLTANSSIWISCNPSDSKTSVNDWSIIRPQCRDLARYLQFTHDVDFTTPYMNYIVFDGLAMICLWLCTWHLWAPWCPIPTDLLLTFISSDSESDCNSGARYCDLNDSELELTSHSCDLTLSIVRSQWSDFSSYPDTSNAANMTLVISVCLHSYTSMSYLHQLVQFSTRSLSRYH
jgi:hypothetical protein